MYGTRTHKIWENMIQRGRGNGHLRERYYDRGIRVCKRWYNFNNFLADMGVCPPGLTIERKNNDGNYEPLNCCWATRKEQSRNTSRNVFVKINGGRLCLKDAAILLGVSNTAINSKIKRGELEVV
jgi:hypothetical protein